MPPERWPDAFEALHAQVQGLAEGVAEAKALRASVAALEAAEKARVERWARFKAAAKGVGLALTPAAGIGALTHQQVLEALRDLLRAWLEAS